MTELAVHATVGEVQTKATEHGYHRDAGLPASWYRVAWSEDVQRDTLLDLHYFGADLICFRAASGDVRVFDAHCPHLGAHLGDGCLTDGEIVCPFHGWRWNDAGENTLIPYADRASRRTLLPWLVDEVNGMVFVWYDPAGNRPTWHIPPYPQYGHEDYLHYFPQYCHVWPDVGVHPQQTVENTTDPAHITFVHHAAEVPQVLRAEADGPLFSAELSYTWGGGRPSTWLTPDGPVDGGLLAECWGLGFIATTYSGIHPSVQFTGATPIDSVGRKADVFTALIGAKKDSGKISGAEFAARLAGHFFEQVEADLPIWARQTLIEHPPYPKLEARAYRDMRMWASTFYEEA